MALIPKKTYSRRNNEFSVQNDKEKENVDPFDELLSSPLKQDVQFQPLSFWGKKVNHFESKKKSKKVDYGLFEASDSDELNSRCQRKRKPDAKYTESKTRTLQPKSRRLKLSDRRKNYSANSSIRKTQVNAPVVSNKNKTLASTDDSNLYPSETIGERLCSIHKSYDTSEITNEKRHFKKTKSIIHSNGNLYGTSTSVRSKENYKINNKTNFINTSSLRFKVYEDCSTSEQQLSRTENETVILNCREDSVNNKFQDSKNLDETFQLDHNSFKFVSIRRHFNYPNSFNMSQENFNASCNSVEHNSDRSPVQLRNNSKTTISAINVKFEDVSSQEIYLEKFDDETLNDYNDSLTKTLLFNESMDRTLGVGSFSSQKSNETSRFECQEESTLSDASNFMCLNDTELEDLSRELQIANLLNGVALETSLTSDDTLSSFNDEDTVIKVGPKAETNDSPLTVRKPNHEHEFILPLQASMLSPPSGSAKLNFLIPVNYSRATLIRFTGPHAEETGTQSVLKGVSVITSRISDLSISNPVPASELSKPEAEQMTNYQRYSNYEDKAKNSFSIDLRNITTKRRGPQNREFERNSYNVPSGVTPEEQQKENETIEEMEFDQTLWMPSRKSLDWNKSICFANPVFESTRVLDTSIPVVKNQTRSFENGDSILEETLSRLDRTYALKPGKKWRRSMSVLKQIQNGSITEGRLESTRITGRRFESFVRDLLEIQNETSGFFTSLANISVSNKTIIDANDKNVHFSRVSESTTVFETKNSSQEKLEKFNTDDSVFSETFPSEKVLDKSALNHTVKVIQPEENPSAFRSALGLDNDSSLQKDSCQEKSWVISARDFLLLQCGQKDVLPFEKYFNERTLGNCRKIGEGVYGEVFMCSDTVIKVIPIEGTAKVNGEHQKTFEEIISEVVIASKLSNLRKGENHRTNGFSEMKRCWCVKGKYPKYLLKLWNEYDQLEGGSENDSPVMFKEDQLYVILELANGGKDLEAFVFNSSAQSLSIFLQAAFSLAVAEKAFEFEHRDLHWGNILISETKEKFMSVILDGLEHKIPTKGVKVCIIDFTLSRITHEGCCIFNDLSVDPALFTSHGDYQFEIYRLMRREVKNDWSLFKPKTNIFWSHYILDKMLKMVRYRNKKTKIHVKHMKDVKTLEQVVLKYKNSTAFVLSDSFHDVMQKLW